MYHTRAPFLSAIAATTNKVLKLIGLFFLHKKKNPINFKTLLVVAAMAFQPSTFLEGGCSPAKGSGSPPLTRLIGNLGIPINVCVSHESCKLY